MQKNASSRSFGVLFAAVFLTIGALNYWTQGKTYIYWGAVAAALIVISLLMPRLLAPLKRIWVKLGDFLNVVVSPVVLSLTYVFAIIPVGVLIRLVGKDLLSLKHDPSTASYWIKRDLGGPTPKSLKDQF